MWSKLSANFWKNLEKEAAYDERFHLRVWSEQIGPKIVQKVAVEAG